MMNPKVLIIGEHIELSAGGYLSWTDAGIDHLVTLGLFSGRYGDQPPSLSTVLTAAKVAALVLTDTTINITTELPQQSAAPRNGGATPPAPAPQAAQPPADPSSGWKRAVAEANRRIGATAA